MLETIFYFVGGITIIILLGLLSIFFLYLIYVCIKTLSQKYYGLAVMLYKLNKMTYKERRILKICYQSIVQKNKESEKLIDEFNNLINN